MKIVYLDHAATTPVSKEVLQFMKPYFFKIYGNASEPHLLGTQAKMAIEISRTKVADFLGAKTDEIIFTGSATESINLAHKGLVEALVTGPTIEKKVHLIVSSIEHKAVLESCRHLERLGLVEITWLPVDQYGQVNVEDVCKLIQDNTILVSVMYVNNEVGTIQPVAEIGKLLKQINTRREQKIYFHTDATQAIQYLNCQVDQLGVDLLSFSGHKFYAPKGIGALYVKSKTPLIRQLDGGGQESNRRAGTENVPYIVALTKALELNLKFNPPAGGQNLKLLGQLRDKLIKGLLQIPGVQLTGHPSQRAPHITSFIIDGVEGESLVLLLSHKGVIASTGSACTSQILQASHVLSAMGIAPENSHGSLRLSLGKDTTETEIDYVLQVLPEIITKLRLMTPNLENFVYG